MIQRLGKTKRTMLFEMIISTFLFNLTKIRIWIRIRELNKWGLHGIWTCNHVCPSEIGSLHRKLPYCRHDTTHVLSHTQLNKSMKILGGSIKDCIAGFIFCSRLIIVKRTVGDPNDFIRIRIRILYFKPIWIRIRLLSDLESKLTLKTEFNIKIS